MATVRVPVTLPAATVSLRTETREPPMPLRVLSNMQKSVVAHTPPAVAAVDDPWLDLESFARVELTSEDPSHPIESAFRDEPGRGWQAASPGEQIIRLHFDVARPVEWVRLRFEISDPRTQEFVLSASMDGGAHYRELVRQQFNFSPGGATREDEDYFLGLIGVTDLKLTIRPDVSGGDAVATLQAFRIR